MNTRFRWMAGLLAAVMLTGCGADAVRTERSGGLQVIASFYVLSDFAQKLAGERATVTCQAGGGDPHDWEPTPRDIAAMQAADLLILNGGGFEHWAGSVVPTLRSERLTVLVTGQDAWLDGGEPHTDRGHNEHDGGDPHFWLDPQKAMVQLDAIWAAFCALDPEGEALYTANLERWTEELQRLDREYEQGLGELRSREVVTSHAAFGHLCGRYGLEQVPVQGLSPEGEPPFARMAEIVRTVESRGITTIFYEPGAGSKVADAIARETGAVTAPLDPLEGLSAERAAAGEDYFTVMRQNLAALEAALQ